MIVAAFFPRGGRANGPILLSAALLASAMVIAQDDPRLEISPTYGELLSDEIYEQAEGWRAPPMFESEWRAPKPQEQGRIRFGFDSAYEELQARDYDRYSSRQTNLRQPRPNTLLRLQF